MTQEDLISAHHYINSLSVDEETKEVCRGIMLGRYWAVTLAERGFDITKYSARELIDMIAENNVPSDGPSA